ncbi:hypothetical protein PVAP13_4KG110840 [Panicum virgatum]|uniref:Uncharacterized protein n=1 Tax=Panicum virgatum TaxID=38727 RepID=A0A8T0TLW3_PANVG|nr:hypothetical protein PVAP13_4KG110840 [Panicum virgatum]
MLETPCDTVIAGGSDNGQGDLLYLAKGHGLFLIKFHRSSERAGTQAFQSCFRDEQIARHIMHMFCCTVEDMIMWSTKDYLSECISG